MMKCLMGPLAAAFGVALLMLPVLTVVADAASRAGICFLNCQETLKKNGTWSSYPRGYCRRKCNYWVGAPPDVRR